MERIALRQGQRRNWVKTRCTGGQVRDVSWNALVHMLRDAGVVDDGENVVRIEIDNYGIHPYTEDISWSSER